MSQRIINVATHAIERSDAVLITQALPTDDAGARAQAGQCLDDEGKAIREIIAGTAVLSHLDALLPGDDPKAIVLNRSTSTGVLRVRRSP